jgi:hypothetical protein
MKTRFFAFMAILAVLLIVKRIEERPFLVCVIGAFEDGDGGHDNYFDI